jgi:hypothetical protein
MQRLLFFIAIVCVGATVACGGGGSSSTTTSASTAQGVYKGTSVSGSTTSTFEAIILPDDRFYAVYGPDAGSGDGSFFVEGFITGQGASSGGHTYKVASLTDYFQGTPSLGSLSATFVAGSSVNGTITEAGLTSTFTGAPIPASTFNYNTPASMSALAGVWTGGVIDGSMPISSVNVAANGSFSGGWTGCSYSGTAVPNGSKNFFDVSMHFQGSGCLLNGQTVTGAAVVSSTATGSQVLVAIATPSYGTVFIGSK